MTIRSEAELKAAQVMLMELVNTAENGESRQYYVAQQDALNWVCNYQKGVLGANFENLGKPIMLEMAELQPHASLQ